jgi:hypothetical protein
LPQNWKRQNGYGRTAEIIEGSSTGFWSPTEKQTSLLVNQSYVRNTGIKKEELIGHNMKS